MYLCMYFWLFQSRVLVTHSITYLPYVDRIIVLKDGQILQCGSYDELLQSQGAFADFLKTYLEEAETLDGTEATN